MKPRRFAGSLILAALVATGLSAQAADFSAWSHKLKLTFAGYDRTETLTNFPALVILGTNVPGFAYGQVASAQGFDLRFSDAADNELDYEIEKWSTNGRSHVWVKVPSLAQDTVVWAYWGNTNATTRPPCTTNGSVWADLYDLAVHFHTNYFCLWNYDAPHFANAVRWTGPGSPPRPTAPGGIMIETPNRSSNAVASLIADGMAFDGADDFGGHQDFGGFSSYQNSFWLECWVCPSNAIDNSTVGQGGALSGERHAWGGVYNTGGEVTPVISAGTNGLSIWEIGRGSADTCKFMVRRALTNWTHVVLVYSNKTPFLYVDGVSQGSGSDAGWDVQAKLNLGISKDVNWNATQYYSGGLDEVRFGKSAAFSSNRAWAAYLNVASNTVFCRYGAQGAGPIFYFQ